MKQYIKFLKFLWVILIVPSLYGMNNKPQYGVVERELNNNLPIVEVTEKALGMPMSSQEEASYLLKRVFDKFEKIEYENNEGMTNILFYNGNLYLNGLMNITHNFDEFSVGEKVYEARQLCGELGISVEEMDAIYGIYMGFPLLKTTIKYNQRKDTKKEFSIDEFWDKSKGLSDKELEDILKTLDEKGNDEELEFYDKTYSQKSYKYLDAAVEYIISSRVLGVTNINDMKFSEQELLNSVGKAEKKLTQLLENFGEYIKILDTDDGESFLQELETIKASQKPLIYLEKAKELCSRPEYNIYTHTEHIIRYLHRDQTDPLYMVSYYDACSDCERMLARFILKKEDHYSETTKTECEGNNRKRKRSSDTSIVIKKSNKYDKIIVSGCFYKNSRSNYRFPELVNPHFLQIQLP